MSVNTFKLDKGFLKELHKRLVKANKEPLGVRLKPNLVKSDSIPSLKHLEEIISAMFWASTQLEEGRLPRFRVGYSFPSGIEHLAMGFNFDSLKLWNAEEIRKLAPAIVPPNGQLCVYPFMKRLLIHGLQSTNLHEVTFEIIEPARMVIRFWINSTIAEITGQKSGFIDDNWNNKGLELMSTYESVEENQMINSMLSHLYRNMTQEILSRIRLLRHGGTIIFVSDNNIWKKSVEKPITYECEMRYNGLRHIEESLNSQLQSIKLKETEDETNYRILDTATKQLISPQYKGFIGDAARSVAYLTAVDGVTILSKNFDVLAFGVKIKEIQKGRKTQRVQKIVPYESDAEISESSLTYEFRGKRHLSAARFVINNPDSIAFTVSQDGGITGFVIEDDKLLAYKGLELLL